MAQLRYRIVDVFSERPLAGNALCVVFDSPVGGVHQALAREVNLSETTFPSVVSETRYDVRIFTPFDELPFAGHPSIGTAWALGPNKWTQVSPGATVTVVADSGGARMTQPDPDIVLIEAPGLVDGLGLPSAEGVYRSTAGGLTHLLVPTDCAIDDLDPDLGVVAAASRDHGAATVGVLRRIDDRTLHARVFGPATGITEDPGTGSAAGPFAVLARQAWGTGVDVEIRQGVEMGRACRIEVHAEEGAITVGGRVAACAEGRFVL